MNFKSEESIAAVIDNLKQADLVRARNRTLYSNLFNGHPPYTKAECDANHIVWNVNWGEGSDLLLQGREQLENAHLSTDFHFTVNIPDAPPSKKSEYGQTVTSLVNKLIKGSLPHLHVQREKWGSVILHGVGSMMWEDDEKWRPYFVPVDDLLVPTDTTLPYDNMNHYGARRRMTAGQLFRKTFGRPENKRDPGWDLEAVKQLLAQYKDINQNPSTWNWSDHPEKAAELFKQNAVYFDSDVVPVIWLIDFYYQKDEDEQARWYRKILLDHDAATPRADSSKPVTVIYDSKRPHAQNISQILHTQFIDGNNVPPFMYHSVRGLGNRLFDPVQALNRVRNQTVQKLMEDLMLLFRAQDPVDRSRLDQIYMGINYGILPEGLSFVTKDQRYQVDHELLNLVLSSMKQLIGEGAQQYTQDIDTGTAKERTAFEVNTLLQQTTRLTGSMLNLSYLQERFAYVEYCRRLTKKPTQDFDAKRIQIELEQAGIPKEFIDYKKWEIEPVRVLGSGNTQLEQAQAQALMSVRQMLNPEAQQAVLHDYVFSFTHDPKRANQLAPLDAVPPVTSTMHDTEMAFGSIMSGAQMSPKPGLIAAEVVPVMLEQMNRTVQEIQQSGGVGAPRDVAGLERAMAYTGAFMEQLAQDEGNKDMVKQFGDQMGQIGNMVKAMAQRQEEIKQKKQQQNGEAQAEMMKVQIEMKLAQLKMQIEQQKIQMEQQRLQMEKEKIMLQMKLDQAEFQAEQQRKSMETAMDIENQRKQAQADVETTRLETASRISLEEKESEAELALAEKESAQKLALAEKEAAAKIRIAEKTAEAAAKNKPEPAEGE